MNYKELAKIGLSKVRVVTDILILIDVTLHVIRLFNEHVRPRIKRERTRGVLPRRCRPMRQLRMIPKGTLLLLSGI